MGMLCTLYALPSEDALRLVSGDSEFHPRLRQSCQLDKAWGAVHYFLSGSGDMSFRNPRPEDFLGSGQILEHISEHAAVHMPEAVIDFATKLETLSSDDLIARFDAAQMNRLRVYGRPWDESGRGYVLQFLDKFRMFVLSAAEQKLAVLIVVC